MLLGEMVQLIGVDLFGLPFARKESSGGEDRDCTEIINGL